MTNSLVGQQLDEYRLEALLGQGGMARVYRALDVRLNRYAAIKVIEAQFRSDSDYAKRFEIEAQAIAKLEHPHIVHVYRYGQVNDLLYMALQYIEGSDLDSVLASYRQDGEFIEPTDAGRIIRQVCAALDYAHGKGVIHRDVKPSNIMLDKEGNAHLTDFGLVLLTELGTRGEIFGSPHYIAPEQAISSAGTVPQSDIYAVGVILYEISTGQLPFDASDPLDVAMLHMTEPPRPPRELRPEITPKLEAVILKAMAKEPANRYQTGAELANALDQSLQASQPSLASRKTVFDRVTLDLTAHPLPPLPAAVASPPTKPAAPTPVANRPSAPVIQPAIEPRRSRLLAIGAIAIGVGLAIVLCLAIGVLVGMYATRPGRIPIALQTSTPDSQTNPATPTSAPQATIKPTVVASQTSVNIPPTPSSEPVTFQLLIVKKGEDSLFIVNQTSTGQDFPLAPLRLGEMDKGGIQGSEWGILVLKRGECATAWKDTGHPRSPDIKCDEIPPPITRSGNKIFWKSGFKVYYNDKLVGTCKDEKCKIDIPGK